jgi:DNA-binding NtrC family response regulator
MADVMTGPPSGAEGPLIFVCDDEMLIRIWFEEHLGDAGYRVESFGDAESLVSRVNASPPDLILLDINLPGMSGMDALPRILERAPGLPVIMITAYGAVELAVAAVRAGAYHFTEKPVTLAAISVLIEQALEASRLRGEVQRCRAGHRWQFTGVTLVGRSPAIRSVAGQIERIGRLGTPATILVHGESGTGKDVVARAVHALGPRVGMPFIDVNCTALPEHLIESELFGHEKGAYTGADRAKEGLFEVAHGGTLFLDEIGDMPRPAQAKLLQFLETHTFRRLGGVRDIEVDVQVVAATNRDLKAGVASGEFREDLFYRLNVVPMFLPPLRDRPEDVEPLMAYFNEQLAATLRRPPKRFTDLVIRAFEGFEWPGNARQLRNVMERLALFHDEEVIDIHHLPPEFHLVREGESHQFVLPPGGVDLEAVEQDFIEQALRRTDGNKTRAAEFLGLSRDTLRYRLEKYGLT